MADDDPALSRVERLRVERLKLSCDQAVKHKTSDEPSTSQQCQQQPLIPEADRFPPSNEDESPFQECQIDGLLKIFEYLTLKERVRLSQTCRRFQHILTDNKASSIRGLTVLNMFQRKVWETSVQSNAISSLTLINISSIEHIVSLLRHVRTIDCLKIWYRDAKFVDSVLEAFNDSVLVRNVDVYPYGLEIALDKVEERFPKVRSITMRPHGTAHFYEEMDSKRDPPLMAAAKRDFKMVSSSQQRVAPRRPLDAPRVPPSRPPPTTSSPPPNSPKRVGEEEEKMEWDAVAEPVLPQQQPLQQPQPQQPMQPTYQELQQENALLRKNLAAAKARIKDTEERLEEVTEMLEEEYRKEDTSEEENEE